MYIDLMTFYILLELWQIFSKIFYYFFLFWSGICGLYMSYGVYFDNYTKEGIEKCKQKSLEKKEEIEMREKLRKLIENQNVQETLSPKN